MGFFRSSSKPKVAKAEEERLRRETEAEAQRAASRAEETQRINDLIVKSKEDKAVLKQRRESTELTAASEAKQAKLRAERQAELEAAALTKAAEAAAINERIQLRLSTAAAASSPDVPVVPLPNAPARGVLRNRCSSPTDASAPSLPRQKGSGRICFLGDGSVESMAVHEPVSAPARSARDPAVAEAADATGAGGGAHDGIKDGHVQTVRARQQSQCAQPDGSRGRPAALSQPDGSHATARACSHTC